MTAETKSLRVGPFCALGTQFSFESDDGEVRQFLGSAFGDLRGRGAAGTVIRVTSTRQRHRFVLDIGDERHTTTLWAPLIPETIMQIVNQRVAASWPHPVIHAAALDVAGTVTLLVGASGSGKTSLSAAMVANGAGYFSDEFAPLMRGGLGVEKYTRPFSVKLSGSNVLAGLLSGLSPVERFEQRIRLVPASHIGRVAERSDAPIGLIVFLGAIGDGAGNPEVEPIGRPLAIRLLAEQSIHLGGSHQEGLELIKVSTADALMVRMTGGDIDRRRSVVQGIIGSSSRP